MAMAFNVLETNIALFLGMVFFILSGLSWNFVRKQDEVEV